MNSLQSTLNWSQPYIEYVPLTNGGANEPALSTANSVIVSILSAPLTWAFNRNEFSFPTVVGQQDYRVGICDFGYLEKVTLTDSNGASYEFRDVYNTYVLGRATEQQQSDSICCLIFNPDNTCFGNPVVVPPPPTNTGIQNTTVQMSAAQYKASTVTPFQILPAPGPNRVIVPLSCLTQVNFVSKQYSINPNPTIGFGTSSSDITGNGWMMFPLFKPAANPGGGQPVGNTAPCMFMNTVTGDGQGAGAFKTSDHIVNQPLYWTNFTDVSGDAGDCTFTLNIQWVEVDITTGNIINGQGDVIFSKLIQLTSAELDPSGPITQLLPAPGTNKIIIPVGMIFWNHNVPFQNPEQIEMRGVFDTSGTSAFALPTPSQMVNQPVSLDPTQFAPGTSSIIGYGTTSSNIDITSFIDDNGWTVNQGVTVSCYIQYVIFDVTTGAFVSSGSTGADLSASYTTMTATQLLNAGSIPIQLIAAPGQSLITLPISYIVLSNFVTTPFSPASSNGFPVPAIGPGIISVDGPPPVPSTINTRFFMAPNFVRVADKLFTASFNQIGLGTPQGADTPFITNPNNTVNAPVYWADGSNQPTSPMDSTGVAMVQYLVVNTLTGNLVTNSGAAGPGMTFRLLGVPDQVYTVTLTYQKKPVLMASLTDGWSGIPDAYSDIYNNLFLADALEIAKDTRAAIYRQRGVAALLAKSEGLSQMQINAFLKQFYDRDAQQTRDQLRTTQGNQARQI